MGAKIGLFIRQERENAESDDLFRQVDFLLERLEWRKDKYLQVHQTEFLNRMNRKLEEGEALEEGEKRTVGFLYEQGKIREAREQANLKSKKS